MGNPFQILQFRAQLLAGLLMLTAGEKALDFSNPEDESTETIQANVVSGVMLVYADLDLTQVSLLDIDKVVASTLGRICNHKQGPFQGPEAPVKTKRYLDINTFGQVRQGLNYTFQLLPEDVLGGPKDCMDRLVAMAYGPLEPPFVGVPMPAIRRVFAGSLHTNQGTKELDSSLWGIGLPSLSCTPKEIIRKQQFTATGVLISTSTMQPVEQCNGAPYALSWDKNPDEQGFDPSQVSNCALAHDDPCICGALPSCEWLPLTRKCMSTPNPGVSCEACSWQRKCWAPNQNEKCSKLTTACNCAAERAGCAWIAGKCLGREDAGGRGVLCTDCVSQARCSTPKVTSLTPPSLSLMGADGWMLQVAFDRPMEFNPILAGTGSLGMLIRCRTYDSSPRAVFELDSTRVKIESNKLQINTKGLRNSEKRDCDLIIYASALRGQNDAIPYSGMQQDTYTIMIPDTIAPTVERIEPANSARGVLVDAQVSLYFTEAVRLGAVAGAQKFILIALGGNGRGSAEPQVIYMSDSRVSFDGAHVRLDLNGQLEHGTSYSLSMPPDALTDRDGNNFTGLASGFYTFETAVSGTSGQIQTDASGLVAGLVIGALVLLLTAGLAFAAWQRCKNLRSRAKVLPGDASAQKARRIAALTIQTTGMRDLEAPEECISPVSPVAALFRRADVRPYLFKLSGTYSSKSAPAGPRGRPPSATTDAGSTPEQAPRSSSSVKGSPPSGSTDASSPEQVQRQSSSSVKSNSHSSSVPGSTSHSSSMPGNFSNVPRGSRGQSRQVSAPSLSGSAAAAGTMSVLLKKLVP
eukprot:TRINITY_DN8296_c0_g1_i2.p1 TRINITY_DN8296_c0_g1~~TRINITY_DN8296_c0_g1_i2.p1  ORF type:complete len:805 (+),score=94.54 TRINITY_DN8296_c0_g1_i2:42-2456(+)